MRCDPQTIGLRPIPLAGMVYFSLSFSTQINVFKLTTSVECIQQVLNVYNQNSNDAKYICK